MDLVTNIDVTLVYYMFCYVSLERQFGIVTLFREDVTTSTTMSDI
jgi:hypothetical protein